MRRQGISGPVRRAHGPPTPFYPVQAARDITVVVRRARGARRVRLARRAAARGPADPTDATYIPRPEWYFLGLFQLLKYFPGQMGSCRRDGGPGPSRPASWRCCRGSIADRIAIRAAGRVIIDDRRRCRRRSSR